MKDEQHKCIEQLRRELGNNEETEHLIDWLLDAWCTWEMLRERFEEARAWQLYTTPALVSSPDERETSLIHI